MVDVDNFTDAELRTKLLEYGFPVMPITGTTRKVMLKKLKLLMENKGKANNNDGRRSLGKYSSEEDSDTDVKVTKKDKNRRATMGAPLMQPPVSASKGRKSARFNDTPEPEVRISPRKEIKTTTTTTTSRSSRIVKSTKDEFDTGSDSESEIVGNNYNSSGNNSLDYSRGSPIKSTLSSSYSTQSTNKYSPPKNLDTSYSRNVSFSSSPSRPSTATFTSSQSASDYASDRLNQIRSRLSLNSPGYEKPSYGSSSGLVTEKIEKGETPFLSNFTRRLSTLSSQKKDYDYKNDIIKEHDTNGSSGYSRSSTFSSYRAPRGRDVTYDYKTNQNSILKNNFVSFAVLAGAALFFIFLAIIYLGMKSDTSVVPSGYIIPPCKQNDPRSKAGVNCLQENQVETALHLLNAIRPELTKRAVANKCFDPTLKPHMTEEDVITFCKTNFALKDNVQIQTDLRNLEILTFANPDWGIKVVQTENNNGIVSEKDIVEDMEKVVFNLGKKITSLVVFKPSVPWSCTLYNTISSLLTTLLFLALVFGTLYAANTGFKYYKYYEQKQKDEIGFMVEKIIEILQSSAGEEGDNFVVINHVRDMILPVTDRQKKQNAWSKAVKFINENESRVRTEIQVVQGEPFEVWRWIGSANLSMTGSPKSKSWQGQAFETQVGSVNSLPCSPTPCLKIRGMVEDGDRNTHMIREAVLSKVGTNFCRVLHCAVDTKSNCVYLKCADTSDAAVAYRNLHGWWYAGHLVTVKYLRLERYMQRFPDSPVNGPYLKAITPATDWAS